MNRREGWADCLRCLSALAVVVLHCAATGLSHTAVDSRRFFALNVLDGSTRWCVPVFLMLSGAFLLDPEREMPAKKWLGHVGRIAAATLLWGFLYGLGDTMQTHLGLEWFLEGLIRLVTGRLHYHLWYLPMLLCLYLLLPVLRALVKGAASRRTLWYTVALLALVALWRDALRPPYRGGNQWLRALNLYTLAGYAGYFLLGWLLRTCRTGTWQEKGLYLLGILGGVVTCTGTRLLSRSAGTLLDTLYSNLSLNVALTAAAIFLLFRRLELGRLPLWSKLSGLTLGTYLTHPFFLERVTVYVPAEAVPLQALCVFVLSLALSWLLGHIPKLGRYIC